MIMDRNQAIRNLELLIDPEKPTQTEALRMAIRSLQCESTDIGEEPVLEEGVSTYHESRADGTGGFVSKEFLDWKCPRCGWFVGELYSGHGMWHVQGETSYCARCGQKIDWTKPKAEEKTRYEERKAREREEYERQNKIRLDNMFEGRRRKYGVMPPEA